MGMWGHLVDRVAEHVVDEAQEATERRRSFVEHMFGRLSGRSDGTGLAQGILQGSKKSPGNYGFLRMGGIYSEDQISSFVRTRSTTASVNSVVPAWPPRSGVLVPEATVSRADS